MPRLPKSRTVRPTRSQNYKSAKDNLRDRLISEHFRAAIARYYPDLNVPEEQLYRVSGVYDVTVRRDDKYVLFLHDMEQAQYDFDGANTEWAFEENQDLPELVDA